MRLFRIEKEDEQFLSDAVDVLFENVYKSHELSL